MNLRVFAAIAASIMVAAAPASAKTKAECTKEWQANEAANQAAGKTEKVYLAQCRGTTAAAPAAKPASGDSKERAY